MKVYIETTADGNVIIHPSIESWTIASLDYPEHEFDCIDKVGR